VRIDDIKRVGLESVQLPKRVQGGNDAKAGEKAPAVASDDVSRVERIEQLKQMFQAGKPIDVNKLADKLIESGIFFDEKA
jgi:anti-sigma28 factor (negative regulator of flagellin synthesis)